MSRSLVIEVGEERDTSIVRSVTVSMTEFREVKTTVYDLRVGDGSGIVLDSEFCCAN
jgi:hypothetical protein